MMMLETIILERQKSSSFLASNQSILERRDRMATHKAVNAGSRFCRDCGDPVTSRGGLAWCENMPSSGIQLDSKDPCRNLTKNNRIFCEHCQHRIEGPMICPGCRSKATIP